MSEKRASLSVDESAQPKTRASEFSLSKSLAKKLADPDHEARQQCWLEENREAIKAYNERIERDGPVLQDLSTL